MFFISQKKLFNLFIKNIIKNLKLNIKISIYKIIYHNYENNSQYKVFIYNLLYIFYFKIS